MIAWVEAVYAWTVITASYLLQFVVGRRRSMLFCLRGARLSARFHNRKGK